MSQRTRTGTRTHMPRKARCAWSSCRCVARHTNRHRHDELRDHVANMRALRASQPPLSRHGPPMMRLDMVDPCTRRTCRVRMMDVVITAAQPARPIRGQPARGRGPQMQGIWAGSSERRPSTSRAHTLCHGTNSMGARHPAQRL